MLSSNTSVLAEIKCSTFLCKSTVFEWNTRKIKKKRTTKSIQECPRTTRSPDREFRKEVIVSGTHLVEP